MDTRNNPKKSLRILWAKRAVAAIAVFVWILLMATIFREGGGMQEQAPKCIFTTMIVFGILTALYKGLEGWEKRQE
ncbi:hypothetical protein [Nitratifractor sp.]